jgi:hypothetical protein
VAWQFDPTLDWKDVDWLCGCTSIEDVTEEMIFKRPIQITK